MARFEYEKWKNDDNNNNKSARNDISKQIENDQYAKCFKSSVNLSIKPSILTTSLFVDLLCEANYYVFQIYVA